MLRQYATSQVAGNVGPTHGLLDPNQGDSCRNTDRLLSVSRQFAIAVFFPRDRLYKPGNDHLCGQQLVNTWMSHRSYKSDFLTRLGRNSGRRSFRMRRSWRGKGILMKDVGIGVF